MSKQAGPAPAQQPQDLTPYLGLPLRLTLSTPPDTHIVGLLFSHDPSTGLVVLETGHNPNAPLSYPTTAAAAPTQRRTNAVAAAQGRASPREPTGFKLVKERNIKAVTVLPNTTAEAASGATKTFISAINGTTKSPGPTSSSSPQPTQQLPAASTSFSAAATGIAPPTLTSKALPGIEQIYAKNLSIVAPVDTSIAERREAAATREAQLRASRIGVGVSEEAQEIFEALSKTLPCRWHDKHIIVMDEVILSEPYDLASLRVPQYSQQLLQKLVAGDEGKVNASELPAGEDLSRARGKARGWERVGKVLEGERRKLAARKAASGGGL